MIGTRLSAYEVLSELGAGGMGTVYLGRVALPAVGLEVGARVALKVIHPHLLGEPGFFKRFLREARIGRRVRHANVVRTIDCDATDVDGQAAHFLVMEYVEGQNLRDLLRELDRVPEALCRHIGAEVALGLHAIHEAGVIHRDLKPENVLITEANEVKVMDLGVARLRDEAIRLSQAGAFVGSLEYAAPEQFSTSTVEPDGRADLHALGVVLYELATGRHPYRGEDASRVLQRVLHEAPPKAGEVNPQISPFLEEVVATLMAKIPEERFATADEVARVLAEGEGGAWWRERARLLRATTHRPLRRVRVPRETALYGRDDELARLRGLYDEVRAGEGRVLLVEGEAGIGKTRLVDEFVAGLRAAGEDVNFLFGSYPPGGAATASGAFSEAYREQFGAEGLETSLGTYLEATPTLVPAFAAVLRGEPSPTGAEPLTQESLQTVFVHATRALAAERPTIVMIDDLHFAPADGRALFASLALAVPGHRVLLVGTMRPGVSASWIADVERHEQASRLVLSRLGPKDLARLLEDAFQSERLARELGYQIALKSDGNPFFAFEIIRGLREGQLIAQTPEGGWASTQVIDDVKVPSSVLDLVKARVADLDEAERDLLDMAACCGFSFEAGLVAQAAGVERIPALKSLGRIERRHRLVRAAGRRVVFDHHQVQEALYDSLMPELREAYHGAIAAALEARAESREPAALEGDLCVDLCRHHLAAGQAPRMLRYLHPALDHLRKGHLNEQALDLADGTLAVPGLLEGAARLEVLLPRCECLHALGRADAETQALEEARGLADALGDDERRLQVALRLGQRMVRSASREALLAHLVQAVALAGEVGDPELEAQALNQLGVAHCENSAFDAAIACHERAAALGRAAAEPAVLAGAHTGLGNCAWAQSRFGEARGHYERALEVAGDGVHRATECAVHLNLGNVSYHLGALAEAQASWERAGAVAREIGSRRMEASAIGNLGLALAVRGRLAEAKARYEEAAQLHREYGNVRSESSTLANLGPLLCTLGDLDGARDALHASLELCRELAAHYIEGYALAGLARLALEEGDTAGAQDLAMQALDLRRRIRHGDGIRDVLLLLGEIALERGDPDAAHAHLDEALVLAQEQGATWAALEALSLQACLPGGDARAALDALAASDGRGDTLRIHARLWKATGDPAQLREARRLVDARLANAPEAYRRSMREHVSLYREILAASAATPEEA